MRTLGFVLAIIGALSAGIVIRLALAPRDAVRRAAKPQHQRLETSVVPATGGPEELLAGRSGRQLLRHPSLVNSRSFLNHHPELREFIDLHPELSEQLKQQAGNPAPISVGSAESRPFQSELDDDGAEAEDTEDLDDLQPRPPGAANPDRAADDEPSTRGDRQEAATFAEFLSRHREIAAELSLDRSLADDDDYLAEHPELARYLSQHPRVGVAGPGAHHPAAGVPPEVEHGDGEKGRGAREVQDSEPVEDQDDDF